MAEEQKLEVKQIFVPLNEYKHFQMVESGTMLTDIFPDGMLVSFDKDGEIDGIYNQKL